MSEQDNQFRPGWVFRVAGSPDVFDDFNFTESMNNVLRELKALGSLLEFYGGQEELFDQDAVFGAGYAIKNRCDEIEQMLVEWRKDKKKPNLSGIDGGAS